MCVSKDEGLAALDSRQVEPASVRRQAVSLAALRSRFVGDEAGSIGMVFGLMVIPCVMLVGFAVDFSRVLAVRQQTQGIIDNAALAGAKATQGATGSIDTVAQTAAASYWNAHKAQITNALTTASSVAYSSNGAKTEMTWTVTQWVQTPFLHAGSLLSTRAAAAGAPAGCSSSGWQCRKIDISSTSLVQAGGNNKETNVETSLMLDITGSMGGQKMTDMKLAAKDLIDIVVWNDQSKVKSRVAIAPFSAKVHVGAEYNQLISGNSTTTNACVTERTGSDAYTDEAPGAGRWITAASCGGGDPSSTERIMPLSNDKTALKQRIDDLSAGGYTAGHLGTAWAWYMLSPKWNTVWSTIHGSNNRNSEPYGLITTGKLRKIAVLMTDGDYNTQYSGTSSFDQAAELCTKMKDTNIEVFTVGFQVSSAARDRLKACATNHAHYYDATTGDALRMAFRDIALKISSIRIKD